MQVNMSIAILPMSAEFNWSPTTVGLVQSSFFWGYLLTQVFTLPWPFLTLAWGCEHLLLVFTNIIVNLFVDGKSCDGLLS